MPCYVVIKIKFCLFLHYFPISNLRMKHLEAKCVLFKCLLAVPIYYHTHTHTHTHTLTHTQSVIKVLRLKH